MRITSVLWGTNAQVKPGYEWTATVLCNVFYSPCQFNATIVKLVACFYPSALTSNRLSQKKIKCTKIFDSKRTIVLHCKNITYICIWLLYYEGKMHRLSLDTSEQLQCYICNVFLSPCQFNTTIVGRLFLPICPHKQSIITQSIYIVSNVPNSCNYFMQFSALIRWWISRPWHFTCKNVGVKIFCSLLVP